MSTNHSYTPIAGSEQKSLDIESSIDGSSRRTEAKVVPYARIGAGVAIATAIALLFVSLMAGKSTIVAVDETSSGVFDSDGRYIMRNFDIAKPMSDFLNGLGGVWGVPMWAFFVNRGQGLASFGTVNKDGGILKFVTAEKAYQQVPFTGFRTFVKGSRGGETFQHQPFFPRTVEEKSDPSLKRHLMIGENELEIQEVSEKVGLQTNVLYFTVTDEDYPSMVRRTSFTNLDTTQPLEIEVLDGLSKLEPGGFSNDGLDAMGRTLEAYMAVYNADAAREGGDQVVEPFFHASQTTADTAQVSLIKEGNFAVAFVEGEETNEKGLYDQLGFVVDPSVVFSTDTTLLEPMQFFKADAMDMEGFLRQTQGLTARTPCAFAGTKLTIPAGGTVKVVSVYGHSSDLDNFVNTISPHVRRPGYVDSKRKAAKALVEEITKTVVTKTSAPIFDDYIKQDYLDNVLRGGLPIPLGDPDSPKIFHTFSRIHGDLERDYNNFNIDTTYFSQGPGNFRDVCQNRRLDVLTNPYVGDFNVRMFLSFVQYDGYNPLTVASTLFTVPSDAIPSLVESLAVVENSSSGDSANSAVEAVKLSLSQPFRPGQFFADMQKAGIQFGIDRKDVLDKIVAATKQEFAAMFAQNGFWTDHWTYTLDLVNNFLAVYPDQLESMLWDGEPVKFYMSGAYVLPRSLRYSVVDDPHKPGAKAIRVYRPIVVWGQDDFDIKLNDELLDIMAQSNYVADSSGANGMWMRDKHQKTVKVSAGSKLLILGILKFSTMDPYGMGVEMEGGKPGWNDAMNGLPGIIGSGMPETYEMLQILRFMNKAIKQVGRAVDVPEEYAVFMDDLDTALKTFASSSKDLQAEFDFWNASNTAREAYRAKAHLHFTGKMTTVPAAQLTALLDAMEKKVERGIERALGTLDGYSPTYFSYECTKYEVKEPSLTNPQQQVIALEFKQHPLPLFLEGPTRYMKTVSSKDTKRDVYFRTRDSDLHDDALQMYAISASLESIGPDVGRMVAFSPGWLENQSIWLHMSYKWYLELLRGGLYEEFFNEIKTGLVPFMDAEVYARSPLEAASFIVSSAFPDKNLHGQGFLARLSGSTAEFLSMWAIMFGGNTPFTLDDQDQLQLALKPVLPGWLFPEEDGEVSFTFVGVTKVTYVNKALKDTWMIHPKSAVLELFDGSIIHDDDAVFGSEHATLVRDQKAKAITITYKDY
mmetsp:Transcript_3019/g.4694  ORF Transcript_3019/g.4694 Transcript_3019/m.4694 type:complete len:1200 (-) Transcript_3019:317-3916(-)